MTLFLSSVFYDLIDEHFPETAINSASFFSDAVGKVQALSTCPGTEVLNRCWVSAFTPIKFFPNEMRLVWSLKIFFYRIFVSFSVIFTKANIYDVGYLFSKYHSLVN